MGKVMRRELREQLAGAASLGHAEVERDRRWSSVGGLHHAATAAQCAIRRLMVGLPIVAVAGRGRSIQLWETRTASL